MLMDMKNSTQLLLKMLVLSNTWPSENKTGKLYAIMEDKCLSKICFTALFIVHTILMLKPHSSLDLND
jgi:hypothetical protein